MDRLRLPGIALAGIVCTCVGMGAIGAPIEPSNALLTRLSAAQTATPKELEYTSRKDLQPLVSTSLFRGYYLRRGELIGERCKELGVDVSAYVAAYQVADAPEFAESTRQLTARGIDEAQFSEAVAGNRPAMKQKTNADLENGQIAPGTAQEVCKHLAADPKGMATAMRFGERQPTTWITMMGQKACFTTRDTPKPDYPASAIQNKEEGTVLIEVEFASDGTMAEARVAKSSGSPALDWASLATAQKWRFTVGWPCVATLPAHATLRIPVTFKLPAAQPTVQ